MDVVFLSPHYPAPEQLHYTRGLAEVGARVFGVGDAPREALPPTVKRALHDYLQVPRIMDEPAVLERTTAWLRGRNVDRVLTNWEPLVLLAARMREAWGVPGMSVDTVLGFRDKKLMKDRVAAAGLRVPYAHRARTEAEVRAAVEDIGYPVVIKPIAGAGSADTYRVDDARRLDEILPRMRHVAEVSVEEFIDGEEFTYDTICVEGRPVYENVAQYLPPPIIARHVESLSPIITTVRDMYGKKTRAGVELGRGVLAALGMGTGFTHMEWFRKRDGEVVFGEIGCRPGGARLVDQMNFTSDIDLFREWARASCWHAFEEDATRRYNCAVVFKRANGNGRIRRVDGLASFQRKYGDALCSVELLPVGAWRRDWTKTLLSDGCVLVRHPDWDTANAIAERAAEEIQLYAG